MNYIQKNKIKKQIVFSEELIALAEVRLSQLGISLPEYVRYLIIKDTERFNHNLPFVDEETEAAIGRSLRDYREGRYKSFKNAEEVDKYLKELASNARKE